MVLVIEYSSSLTLVYSSSLNVVRYDTPTEKWI